MRNLIFFVATIAALAFSTLPSEIRQVEICDNAIDDDNDGLIDLNDEADCLCKIAEPISLIPNPSFEDKSCCPASRSSLHCAETWIQASEATTDYLHECGWFGWENLPAPTPLPDGQACIGFRNGRYGQNTNPNWKEYTGACLTEPLRAGNEYRFEFYLGFTNYQNSPPLNVVFYGTPDCKNLPFGKGNDQHGCPLNGDGWILLDRTYGAGANNWIKLQFVAKPTVDIQAVAIGPDCIELDQTDNPYYFLDNLILADVKEFEYIISPLSHPCDEKFTLSLPEHENVSYQWYQEGVALIGETNHELKPKKEGWYQVRIIDHRDNDFCRTTKSYYYSIPVIRTEQAYLLCEGDTYVFKERSLRHPGTYIDTFQTVDNCDSIVSLNLETSSRAITYHQVKIFPGEAHTLGKQSLTNAGKHLVTLSSSHQCDSLVEVDLQYYQVYIPNAITPNGDGINDGFGIFGSLGEILEVESLEIYNRWGNLLYQMNNIPPNREISIAHLNLETSQMLVYKATVIMDDQKPHLLAGSFVVI